MENITLDFIFKGKVTAISAQSDEYMFQIFDRFLTKRKLNRDEVYFIYNCKRINESIHLRDLTKNKHEIFISVYTYANRTRNLLLYLFFITLIIVVLFILFRFIKSNKSNKIITNKEKLSIKKNKKINEDDIVLKQNINENIIKSLSSKQLRHPENIEKIDEILIEINLEYENYLHMKIIDNLNDRWEVPSKEIINKEYLNNLKTEALKKIKKNEISENNLFTIKTTTINNNFNIKLYTKTTENENEFFSFDTSKNFLYSDKYINFEFLLSSNDIYGFGERSHDFKLSDGIYTTWPLDCSGTRTDDGLGGMNQYSHQPIGLHKTKFNNLWLGLVFLNTNSQDLEINSKNDKTSLMHKTIGGIIDYYIIIDTTPEKILQNIQKLIGIPTLPPYWTLGNHQCRYGYKTFEDFKEVYSYYKMYNISIDTMWIDIDSYNKFELFTVNKKFELMPEYVQNTIHKDGGKFVPIVDIGLSYENQNNPYVLLGKKHDLFIKSNYTKNILIGKVWPGKTVFPDFFNPNINLLWDKGLNDYYKLTHFDGIWLDMNEPALLMRGEKCVGEVTYKCDKKDNKFYDENLPYLPGYRIGKKEKLSDFSMNENALVYGNLPVYDIKPLISYYENKQTFYFLKNELKYRPFILSRSTTLGAGKYTFHWLGDNYSTYISLKESISGIFSFNIFGIPFTGADICGFIKNTNKNLCLRWYNIGVFYPFSRNHNSLGNSDQFPWSFDTEARDIIKKDIDYRYSLIRYMYSQLFLISLNEKGSFFKPVLFEFPNDENSYIDIENKIMFGEAFLICAFIEESTNSKFFILPKANFNLYPSGKNIMDYNTNERKIELSGEFNQLYIFLRGGYIVPMQNTFNKYIINTEILRGEKLNLIISPDNLLKSKGVLFFDNDEVDTVENKKYYRVDMIFENKKMMFKLNKNNLEKYNYKDDILEKIEIWRFSEIFGKITKISAKIKFNIPNKGNIDSEGVLDNENDKVAFDFNKESISIFNIEEILFE